MDFGIEKKERTAVAVLIRSPKRALVISMAGIYYTVKKSSAILRKIKKPQSND